MAKIYYARVDEFWRKEQKLAYLDDKQHIGNIEWQELKPDAKHNWLTEGMHDEFETFLPIVDKTSRDIDSAQIFVTYSPGVNTARDTVAYNFDTVELLRRVEQFSENYNAEVQRYRMKGQHSDLDSFLKYEQIKWSRNLKRDLRIGNLLVIDLHNCREGAYRPFAKRSVYFADIIVDELGKFPRFFPTVDSEKENFVICVSAVGSSKSFHCLVTNSIADFHFTGDSSCFPFYTYNEDGTGRRENITDWAVEKFRAQYKDKSIGKWDIFYYVYAVLHHPLYRERYAANLKRELPRIPYPPPLQFSCHGRSGQAFGGYSR